MRMNVARQGASWLRNQISQLVVSLSLLFVMSPLLAVTPAIAQQTSTAKTKEADRKRHATAVELVVETAEAARTFKDLFYRARIQALSADLLWPSDESRARTIFRRAWEAATAYDKAEQEAEDRESGVPSTLPITEARDEVLVKAAARDSKLAESFLRDLLADKTEETNPDKSQSKTQRTPWREMSETGLRRLALAYELLRHNQPARAAEVIGPVINEGASGELVTFLIRLREQSAQDADALYLRLIERTRSDGEADANDVLLVSAPIVSPRLLVVVDAQGALQFRPVPQITTLAVGAPVLSPDIRSAFYSVASNILLRPIVPRVGQYIAPEAIGLYFAIGRLFPFFERDAPQFVSALRLRNSTLANAIESGRRENLDGQFELTSLTPDRPGDSLGAQINQLGRARDAQDRDRIALGIVKRAAKGRLWDRARRAAMEIEDIDVRRAALSYLAVFQIADLLRAFSDDKEENVDALAKFVRNADVPPLASAWGLAQTAAIASRKGDLQSAQALLDEALAFAGRTPAGTWQRVAAYIAVAQLAARIDAKRVWEIMPDIVRAANSLEDFAGDEVSIDIEAGKNNADQALEPLSFEADVFRLDSIFAIVAQLDYEKALAVARSFGKETPRAFASLAIARVMLKGRTQKSEHSTQD